MDVCTEQLSPSCTVIPVIYSTVLMSTLHKQYSVLSLQVYMSQGPGR